jgi:hypothetical protein
LQPGIVLPRLRAEIPARYRPRKISPHLGYKEKGVENLIPPNAVLVYEIELLEVK